MAVYSKVDEYVIVTSFGESSNLVSKSKMFVKDKAKVSSRVGGVE